MLIDWLAFLGFLIGVHTTSGYDAPAAKIPIV